MGHADDQSADTIAELARRLHTRDVTSESITEHCLTAIAEKNGALNAFITVLGESALAEARHADREIADGRVRGPLHGVPVSLKDLIDMRGVPTTAASHVRDGHVAAADAEVVSRLREAGAVVIGKCNLHEFAFGTTCEESAFGPVRHPLDPTRSPGGSSGGSAVSVATGMAYASIGTDTGGSIRIPSAACGLVGLKPAINEIPTHGVVPLSRTLDHVGPLCRSVADAELVFDALRTRPAAAAPTKPIEQPVTLGIPREYFLSMLDRHVASNFDAACERLRGAGAVLEEVTIPHAGDIASVYLHIVLCEAAAYHAKTLESRPELYSEGVRLRLEMGRYLLAEDYVRALQGREVLRHEVNTALTGRSGFFLPTLPIAAPKFGATEVRIGTADEPIRNVMLRLTQLFNLSGHPAITMPCGMTPEGLPVGVQLIGHTGRTSDLLRLAGWVEPYLLPGGSR